MYELYKHYSGKVYLRLLTALHSETLEPFEVYRSLYDNPKSQSWMRPQSMFHEHVNPTTPRFTLIARVGRAAPEDDLTIFGQEVRDDAKGLAAFDTGRNRWFLEDAEGQKRSMLNALQVTQGVVGIASLATLVSARGQGYASLLVRAVMELQRVEDPKTRFMLFSGAHLGMFERLGFRALPESDQHCKPSVAMATGDQPLSAEERAFIREYF